MVSLFPYLVFTALELLVVVDGRSSHLSLHYMFQLVYLNSLLHPCLYVVLSDDIRVLVRSLKRLLDAEKRELDKKQAKNLLTERASKGERGVWWGEAENRSEAF